MRGERMDSELEAHVRQMLKDIDQHLDVHWMDVIGRYALMIKWADHDKRWEDYRAGLVDNPFDLLGWFVEPDAAGSIHNGYALPQDPLDMMDTVVAFLGKMDNTRDPWRDRMRRSVEGNARLQRERRDAIVNETMDVTEHYRKKFANQPTIHLGDGTQASIQQAGT